MQICPNCFDDMKMVAEPQLHFVCSDCGYKDESWKETKMECVCCQQDKKLTQLIKTHNGQFICKDRIKCNEVHEAILNTV